MLFLEITNSNDSYEFNHGKIITITRSVVSDLKSVLDTSPFKENDIVRAGWNKNNSSLAKVLKVYRSDLFDIDDGQINYCAEIQKC